jgi:hypothetical protein
LVSLYITASSIQRQRRRRRRSSSQRERKGTNDLVKMPSSVKTSKTSRVHFLLLLYVLVGWAIVVCLCHNPLQTTTSTLSPLPPPPPSSKKAIRFDPQFAHRHKNWFPLDKRKTLMQTELNINLSTYPTTKQSETDVPSIYLHPHNTVR